MRVKFNPAALADMPGVRFIQEGSVVRFMLEGRDSTVSVQLLDGDQFDLFPERSHGHRDLVKVLTVR